MLLKNKMKNLKIPSFKFIVSIGLLLVTSLSNATSLKTVKYNTIQNNAVELAFALSDSVSSQPIIKTSMNPARIEVTFDADDFDSNFSNIQIQHAGVKTIHVQKQAGKVVAIIDFDKLPTFDVKQVENVFSLVINDDKGAKIEAKTTPNSFINNVASIDFRRGDDNEGQVFVYLDDSMVAVDVSDKLGKIYVEFHNTKIAEDLLYKLDVADFGTVVKGIETFKEGKNARLVIDVDGSFTFKNQQNSNVFSLTVKKKEKKPTYLGGEDEFAGKAISLNFQDIPVRTVLQIIADYNGFNLVTSDTVSGNVTLRLDGVPWDQALDIILKVKGLDKRMDGNILLVAPSDELAAREAKELKAKQQVAELAPLYSEYVQINYAKAGDIASLIKNEDTSILSARGTVSVDERTNILLIRDTAKSIEDIKRMVNVLDIPVRQVVIEARMVTVKDNVNEELGIRWGVTNTDGEYAVSGSLEGVGEANGTRATTPGVGKVPSLADGMNVNLPAASGAASIAFQVARLADGTILDLELSALEKENKGEIIASPRITTANQKEAYIEQGVEIPYQQAASSGATAVQFKKAVLSLTVTPHITPDNRIILDLVVTQDTVSEVTNGQAPAIDTQRIGTQVLVNNGETIVLGGIYQQAVVKTVSKVPVLGDVPYFGWLFRNKNNFNEKKELLIFVTPRIVTDNF